MELKLFDLEKLKLFDLEMFDYDCIQGADFFRMGTFIDSTHMKL